MNTTNDFHRVRIAWTEKPSGEHHIAFTRPGDESWQARLASAYNHAHGVRGWHVALVNRIAADTYRVQMGHWVASANATQLAPEMSVWLDEES